MVQWTTPFMIGVTQMISNSEIPPPSSGLQYIIPQSTFARMSGLEPETPSFGD
jgi:hypothetical protein